MVFCDAERGNYEKCSAFYDMEIFGHYFDAKHYKTVCYGGFPGARKFVVYIHLHFHIYRIKQIETL